MKNATVHQFSDSYLSQYGYLIISNGKAAAIDPPRNVQPMLDRLAEHSAELAAVIETHPHADFVSGHLELHERTGAPILISKLVGADYDHTPFDSGDHITLGAITLEAINTPGHSPDSISILARETDSDEQALFSGDTLFVGDVGRPDLREKAGNIQAKREELAGMMYDTVQTVLKHLPDATVVYPAHGAGSLCGKALRDAPSTTIGDEKRDNPAFADMTKAEFITMLTEGQPFIPQYFPFEVGINKAGAPALADSLALIPTLQSLPENILIVDTRETDAYNAGHTKGALHIAENGQRFETWLGTIVAPDEQFAVVVANEEAKTRVLNRIAAIGYETNVCGVYVGDTGEQRSQPVDIEALQRDPQDYTIIDVRQSYESESKPLFAQAINIPLNELRDRTDDIPRDKPIAVHCAGGYRSMIAESIIAGRVSVPVYDVAEHIKTLTPISGRH